MEIYLLLKVVWWVLLGVLLMGLAIMVGMDMGVGTVLRYVGRTDSERRVALNIIGPHWDGNQVWFILGGGAIFAAWPIVYATAFSGLYVVMLLLLWSMIVRPLGFEYRSKLQNPAWRNAWDWSLFVSGFVPMLIFGAAIGNALQGFPFHFDWNLASYYTGSFIALFNPFAILCGLLSVALSVYMGCAILMMRGDEDIYARAKDLLTKAALAAIALFSLCGLWVPFMQGYRLVQAPDPNLAQTPTQQTVELARGDWLSNFLHEPLLWLVPHARLRRPARRPLERPARSAEAGLVEWRTRLDRSHRHRRGGHVPLHDAIQLGTLEQPDGVECLVERDDLAVDGRLYGRLHAADPLVHQLGILGDARQGERGACGSGRSRLLTGG